MCLDAAKVMQIATACHVMPDQKAAIQRTCTKTTGTPDAYMMSSCAPSAS